MKTTKILVGLLSMSLAFSSSVLSVRAYEIINESQESVTATTGDVNADGVLNVMDAVRFQKWLLGFSDEDISVLEAADLNNDGKVNIVDYCLLKNIILGNSESVVNESQPGIGLHSVSFKNYDELSEKIEDALEELIIEMKNEKADTATIENYKTNILSKQSVSLPFSDGKELPLRNEDGYSNITFYTRELFSKPCFFIHFEDGTTNSYIKIFDVSSEVKTTGALNTYDFMNAINPSPEKGLFYSKYDSISKENVIINGKTVEVVFRNIENDPRVYADFLYGDSLVFVCCSKEKIDSGFLESLSIADLPLKSSEQEAEPGDIQKLRAD